MENEETPEVAAAEQQLESATTETTESPETQARTEANFNVWESKEVDWMDDPTLANGPDLTHADFVDLPAGAKRVLAKVRSEYKQRRAQTAKEMHEVRALRSEIDKLKVSRLQELADLQRHVQRERFRALDKPVEVPNSDPSSSEYIQAIVSKAVAERVAEFQKDLEGMTTGAAQEVKRMQSEQNASEMQRHTLEQVQTIKNPILQKEFVRELQEHAARYHDGKFHKTEDLESAIEMAKLKIGLLQRNKEDFIPKSYKDENRAPQNLDEVYGDYAEMSAGQLAQLMVDHPEEADKILKRRKRYLSER